MAFDDSCNIAARLPRAACISALLSMAAPLLVTCLALVAASPSLAAGGSHVPVPADAAAPAAKMPAPPASPKPAKAAIVNPSWNELPPRQQQALAPLVTEWDKLDAVHKSKWLAIGRKFETMKPDEQNRVQERMRAWAALTPDQRRVARESYVRTRKLDTDQKSAQWQQYQQLPEEQKKKLAAEAAKNKVATPPPAQGKPKTIPPIKSVQKPVLQQSLRPKSGTPSATMPQAGDLTTVAPTTDK